MVRQHPGSLAFPVYSLVQCHTASVMWCVCLCECVYSVLLCVYYVSASGKIDREVASRQKEQPSMKSCSCCLCTPGRRELLSR
jgi:hypothetical protein